MLFINTGGVLSFCAITKLRYHHSASLSSVLAEDIHVVPGTLDSWRRWGGWGVERHTWESSNQLPVDTSLPFVLSIFSSSLLLPLSAQRTQSSKLIAITIIIHDGHVMDHLCPVSCSRGTETLDAHYLIISTGKTTEVAGYLTYS